MHHGLAVLEPVRKRRRYRQSVRDVPLSTSLDSVPIDEWRVLFLHRWQPELHGLPVVRWQRRGGSTLRARADSRATTTGAVACVAGDGSRTMKGTLAVPAETENGTWTRGETSSTERRSRARMASSFSGAMSAAENSAISPGEAGRTSSGRARHEGSRRLGLCARGGGGPAAKCSTARPGASCTTSGETGRGPFSRQSAKGPPRAARPVGREDLSATSSSHT